jgi:peptidoglycan/xylan/chitin deacetylase (PgdA/CDA1 family)
MKRLLRFAVCAGCKYSGAVRLGEARADWTGQGHAVILLFHRVTDDIPEDGLTVGTARFAGICRLLRRTFRVVSLSEVFRLARSGQAVPPRTAAVTFDDCYHNNLAAAEVLAQHELPATFFVPASFVGTNHTFPWDRHQRPLSNLTWDDLRVMADMGFEIGSHTLTHPNLATLALAEARHEIANSRKVIEERLGRPVRWFAYPFGGPEHFREDFLPLVAEAGYVGCVSAHGGFVRRGTAGLMLPREPVPMPVFRSLLHLEVHLRGGLDWIYRLRAWGRRKNALNKKPNPLHVSANQS